jgi:hypothetical protein
MNKFTKDDLNNIADGVALLIGRASLMIKPIDNLLELYGKVESMIDNYCEHKWINATYCEKCNKNMEL